MHDAGTSLSQQALDALSGASARAVGVDAVRRRRPIIYSTSSIEQIKRLVAQAYDFDDSVDCTFFCRGVSDTYLLSAQGRRFAVRVYRSRWRTRRAIMAELEALQHLGAKGIEVAMPVARRDGGLITAMRAPEGLRNVVLFEWANGRAPKYADAGHAQQYGRLVARMHIAADDLPPSALRPQMDTNYMLLKPLELIRVRLKGLPSESARLEMLAERLLARMSDAATCLYDWGFCHGDLWSGNARIDGDRLVLFDFDFCGSGWRISDLASYRWHARFQGREQPGWEHFVEGYLQERPVAAESLQFVGLFMILRHLWTTAHWIRFSAEAGAVFPPEEFFEELVPFCEKIEAECSGSQ